MAPAPVTTSSLAEAFDDMERQRELVTNCTRLWKELSDHMSALEKDLDLKSERLRCKIQSLDTSKQDALDSLRRREATIETSVAMAISKVEECRNSALEAISRNPRRHREESCDLVAKIRSLCVRMDSEGFWDLVTGRRKEVEAVRAELGDAIGECCVDPARFVMDAMAGVFPVDRKAGGKGGLNDYGWACVMLLETLLGVFADPELGMERKLVTPGVRERALSVAEKWKEGLEVRGGVEGVKPPDVHTFLQHVVTFGVLDKKDRELYRKLVVGSSWRRQMPKLTLELGLGDIMTDIIDELISKGQQLDAVNFAFEAGLEDKYPPIPLLRSYIEDSKKAATTILEDRHNSGRALHIAGRKEQSALRAVIKCIEEHKLESDLLPLDTLQKHLENLEKAKVERKRPATLPPPNKRTRATNNGGLMPPAKAGRLTNHSHVPSFSTSPAFVRSPSHSPYQAPIHPPPPPPPPYVYERSSVHSPYGSQSPPAMRLPVNYPIYGGYSNGFAPGYRHQAAAYYC